MHVAAATREPLITLGLAYVTEDRKQLGLILADDVRKNITLASLKQVAPNRVIDDIAELKIASDYRNRMRIRCADVYQETGRRVLLHACAAGGAAWRRRWVLIRDDRRSMRAHRR